MGLIAFEGDSHFQQVEKPMGHVSYARRLLYFADVGEVRVLAGPLEAA